MLLVRKTRAYSLVILVRHKGESLYNKDNEVLKNKIVVDETEAEYTILCLAGRFKLKVYLLLYDIFIDFVDIDDRNS